MAAGGANAVGADRRLTMRTGRQRRGFEEVIRTPEAGSGIGMSSFGVRHRELGPE